MDVVQTLLLLGWMKKENAVKLLMEDAVPPLSEPEAGALWQKYADVVGNLEARPDAAPRKQKLNATESTIADDFLLHHRGNANVKDVIKVNPMELIARQLNIALDQCAIYQAGNTSRSAWIKKWLAKGKPGSMAGWSVQYAKNHVDYGVPHGEWGVHYDLTTSKIEVREDARHVSLTAYGTRMMLWAGYHRSYGMVRSAPEGADRSLVAALTDDGTFAVSNGSPDQELFDLLCGLRPPLFADFFDERFVIQLALKKKKFVLQVRARILPVDA
jgi:hypothetical protein